MAVRPAAEKRTRLSGASTGKAAKAPKTGSSGVNYAIAEFTKDEELKAYRDMLLIRRFEEKAGQLYGMGLIGGFCHLYIGQEAVVVGIQSCLREGVDQVATSYRDHGHMLACGMAPKGVMAELTGRRRRPTPRARAARCTCSASRSSSSVATASSARRCSLGVPASPSPTSYREQRQRLRHLFRRRRGQPGSGLRKLQHGRALEAAGRCT